MVLTPRERVLYSPIIGRPRLEWPDRKRLALWIAPNVEHYEFDPPANPLKVPYGRAPHPDIQQYSYRDYGNRVGVWRVADVLDDYGVRATVSLNTAVLDLFPEVATLIRERDWAVMGHGIYNTRYLLGMTDEEERAGYAESIESVRRHLGKPLKGALTPSISGSPRSPDLMAAAGLVYDADWVHDDQPVPILVDSGRLISMPYSYELNDAVLFQRHYDGTYFVDLVGRQFDRLRAQSAETGLVMCISLHPFNVGQPHLVGDLRRLLDRVMGHDDVWYCTADEIADWYLDRYYDQMLLYALEFGGKP